jgi:hypothetical protein
MTGHEETSTDWDSAAFRAAARHWIDQKLAETGQTVAGPIEQPHIQWWATAMRVPTSDGVVWFKAAGNTQAFETALQPLLARLSPEHSAEVVATDVQRGWMLTRDAGVRLREHASGEEQLRCWEELLPQYAALQTNLAELVPDLLAIGVADLRTAGLADQAALLAADRALLSTAPEDSLTEDEIDAFAGAGLVELRRLCDELGRRGIPDTLQHDDLHDGNLFVRDGEYVFFDWGDACISHPFHTLVVTLRALGYKHSLPPGAPELLRLRDAYLEGWTSYAPLPELIETAEMARRTGTIQRALAWYRVVNEMPPDRRHEEQDSVPYGVRLFLKNEPWGAWQ